MGMYTEMFFRAEISREAANIIEAVTLGVEPEGGYPEHEFFRTPRFDALFTCTSAYFPGDGEFTLVRAEDDGYAQYGPDADKWSVLSFRSSFKNYNDEADLFFDWINPHLRCGEGEFLGYSLYEEGDSPVLRFKAAS